MCKYILLYRVRHPLTTQHWYYYGACLELETLRRWLLSLSFGCSVGRPRMHLSSCRRRARIHLVSRRWNVVCSTVNVLRWVVREWEERRADKLHARQGLRLELLVWWRMTWMQALQIFKYILFRGFGWDYPFLIKVRSFCLFNCNMLHFRYASS